MGKWNVIRDVCYYPHVGYSVVGRHFGQLYIQSGFHFDFDQFMRLFLNSCGYLHGETS